MFSWVSVWSLTFLYRDNPSLYCHDFKGWVMFSAQMWNTKIGGTESAQESMCGSSIFYHSTPGPFLHSRGQCIASTSLPEYLTTLKEVCICLLYFDTFFLPFPLVCQVWLLRIVHHNRHSGDESHFACGCPTLDSQAAHNSPSSCDNLLVVRKA